MEHTPVMLAECLELLNVREDGVYVDGTVGLGGHAAAIAAQLSKGSLICIDRDAGALQTARERLDGVSAQVTFHHGNYRELPAFLREDGLESVDGILLDLGVSSRQLDQPERGFSYRTEAPLDMRMDEQSSLTAREVVNEWPAEQLRKILFEYGEENNAPLITKAIVRARAQSPIETTTQLADIVVSSLPPAARRGKHPAKRTFQAVRIAVNDELDGLAAALLSALPCLSPGGRLVVITFHSLEDRMVKTTMNSWAEGCRCPPDFPVCVCGRTPAVRILTKKPRQASEQELLENRRAHSAKVRACEKI